jgi:hypothetical protein
MATPPRRVVSGALPVSLKKINLFPYCQRHHGFASGAVIIHRTYRFIAVVSLFGKWYVPEC